MENNDMWYLMSDFFHNNKCHTGFIDPKDPDLYAFKKNNYIFRIRRINDHDYRLRVIEHSHKGDSKFYHYCKSIEDIENTILRYYLKKK